MANTSLRGTRLGATSYENDSRVVIVDRVFVAYSCPKGHETQDTGNSECSPCAKGYYNSVVGTSCDPAPAGTFVNSTAAVVFTAW